VTLKIDFSAFSSKSFISFSSSYQNAITSFPALNKFLKTALFFTICAYSKIFAVVGTISVNSVKYVIHQILSSIHLSSSFSFTVIKSIGLFFLNKSDITQKIKAFVST
jgi:hypothetical protein